MLNTASFRKDAVAGRCEGCSSHFRNQPWKEPEQLTQYSPKTIVLKPGDMIGKQSMEIGYRMKTWQNWKLAMSNLVNDCTINKGFLFYPR
jgi:hypothetical protein